MQAKRIHRGQITNEGEIRVRMETWRVIGAPTDHAALTHPDLPVVGDTDPNHADFIVSTPPTLEVVEDGDQVYDITVRYETPLFGVPTIESPELTTDYRSEFLSIWRKPPFKDPDEWGSVDLPEYGPDYDIGGRAVDAAGEPVDEPHFIHEFVLTGTVKAPLNDAIIAALQNHRNSKPIFNRPIGSVLFIGGFSRKTIGSAVIPIELRFAYDPIWHLRQRVFRDTDGEVPYALADPGNSLNGTQAKVVNFHQPFPFLADLSLLVNL